MELAIEFVVNFDQTPNCRRFVTRNDMEFPSESMSHFLQGGTIIYINSQIEYVQFL